MSVSSILDYQNFQIKIHKSMVRKSLQISKDWGFLFLLRCFNDNVNSVIVKGPRGDISFLY